MRTGKRVNRVATLCAVSVHELASSLLAYYGSNICWAQQSPVSHLLCQDSPSITSHWKPIGGLLLSHHKHHWHPRRPSTSRFALIDNSSLSDTSRAARRAPYVHAIKVARGGGRHLAEAQLFVFFFSLCVAVPLRQLTTAFTTAGWLHPQKPLGTGFSIAHVPPFSVKGQPSASSQV
ncbi:hypothetical protein K456DRAFT_1383817 [Colletotrichum gloeosporioides 23]|nr:hypothetical protein K456DRAFT_1383817 [Colletotrichum gloeosporioides 23]